MWFKETKGNLMFKCLFDICVMNGKCKGNATIIGTTVYQAGRKLKFGK